MRAPSAAALLLAAACSATARSPAAAPPPAAAAPAHAPAAMGAPASEAPPALQLPPDVSPLRYGLELAVVPTRDGFSGTSEIEIRLDAPRRRIWLHGKDLRVSRATIEAAGTGELAAEWAQVNEDGLARLDLPRPVGPGRAVLRFRWEAAWGRNLSGLYLSRTEGEAYATSQLEAIGARKVFPGFDEPRFKTPFDVALTVRAADVAVSVSPAASEAPAGEGLRRVRFATTEPIPTYLLYLGVGPFEVVTPAPLPPNDVRPRPLPIRLLAPKGHGGELRFAAAATAEIVPWFERYFAIPFPYAKLDQIAVSEFAAGAMENAGAIAYRASALLDSAGTSEEDRSLVFAIQAHEIAHQWFGDLVTLPWWTDTWMNESFATWMEQKAEEALRPEWSPAAAAVRDVDRVMRLDATGSARAVRQPLAAMSDVWGQFDGLSYEKGAAVLRTFERWAGAERFREGIRAYLAAHRHGTGSVEDLYAALSRGAGRDLAPGFAALTDRPGVPRVTARLSCGGDGARLALSQAREIPRGSDAAPEPPWQVPVCARWEGDAGVREACTLLVAPDGSMELGRHCPAWAMPQAGGAAYYRWALAPDDLSRLRRVGLRRLSTAEKISLARNLRAAQQSGATPWADAMEAIAALARDRDPDVALEPAEVLSLVEDRIVPAGAREAVAAFARRLYGPVLARVGWSPAPREPLGTGRLRHAALDLLVVTGRDRAATAEAARRGRALLGLDGAPPRPGAVDPGLAEVAILAAVREGGAPAFDAIVAALPALQDASLRQKVISALARQDDPALAARAAALWRNPAVRPHEYRYLFWPLARRAAGRAALVAEVARDFDALAAALPEGGLAYLPFAFFGGCDEGYAAQVRAALEPHVAAHPELRRPLAQALEQIRICAAEREADGAAAGAFFARAPGRPHGAARRSAQR